MAAELMGSRHGTDEICSRPPRDAIKMDWSDVIQKMVNLANEVGEISVDQFSELIPAAMTDDDIEHPIEALNGNGVWIRIPILIVAPHGLHFWASVFG
jgi:hypothetical protein